MMTHKIILISALAIGLSASSAPAAEISGVKLPDQVTVGGKNLKLNGLGLRQATILKINAYAGGLLLLSNSGRAQTIFPSLVKAVFGETGLPWSWEYNPPPADGLVPITE